MVFIVSVYFGLALAFALLTQLMPGLGLKIVTRTFSGIFGLLTIAALFIWAAKSVFFG